MARISGTRNITSNSIQTIRAGQSALVTAGGNGTTGTVVINAGIGLTNEITLVGTITNITLFNPLLVTVPSHGLTTGTRIVIQDVIGTSEVNGNTYYIDPITTEFFGLYNDPLLTLPVDGNAFTPYVGSGTVYSVSNDLTVSPGVVQINPFNSGTVIINEQGGRFIVGGINDQNILIGGLGFNEIEIGGEGGGSITVPSPNTKFIFKGTNNVGNLSNPTGAAQTNIDNGDFFSTKEQRELAGAYFESGVGIEQDLSVGGFIYGRIAQALTSTSLLVEPTNANIEHYVTFIEEIPDTSVITGTGVIIYADPTPTDLRYNPATGRLTVNRQRILNAETSTSTDTGALQVAGGVAITKDLTIGGVAYAQNDFTTQYLENIYETYLGLPASRSKMVLAAGATDIFGEIQVRGKNPIGTGPVVTNVLYVTVDGNDTNDGRAQDPSRACRTIGGALKSPYYQSGTQIRVSAGLYLENNPLRLKPYTSIMGSDIRTTFIEPINKTQDLFHVESGCYIAFCTFLNGRSGKLQGEYTAGVNRGAYCTAFPPQTGEDRIDLFHSPYIQNCTNQTGPWLRDGTMFIPSQTVQIPTAVGTGTWAANTTSIIVNIGDGSISIGQSVNAGQQNQGFFNARALLLANKPFLQSQVVAFVDSTFSSGSFSYNPNKCRRDTGLILNAIANDMLYDSTSDSTFAGLQYWNQDSYTGSIAAELTATIAAINYLSTVTQTFVSVGNAPVLEGLFNTITGILSTGTSGVTDQVIYGGLPSTNATTLADYDSLQSNKVVIQGAVVDWVNNNFPTLTYDEDKCFRDVGYMVDSVSFDLLHGGNIQSIKSGVYYYDFNTTSTAIAGEIPQTTAAYNYIKSILTNIVTGTPLPSPYQTVIPQVTAGDAGNAFDAEVLETKLDTITNIIRNGPTVAPTREPISLTLNTATSLLNAYSLLIANVNFIKEEVIAYVDATLNNFQYNRQKCYRDVAILVENMSYDMAFGGNEKSVESGLAYYSGVTSVIAGQETQTISAIDYLGDLCKQIVVNTTCTVLVPPVGIPDNPQVINTALTDGEIAIESIEKLFNITTEIIEDGPSAAPPIYTSTGPDAAFVSAQILLEANRTFIQENTLNYINHVLCYPPKTLPYNQIKCRRDAKVIVDSIASDMYFGSFTQSIFSGRQYYAIDGYTGSIKTEIQPTIRAVRYLRDMAVKVVECVTEAEDAAAGIQRYSTGTQTTSTNVGSADSVEIIENEFNIILNILNGNTSGWTDRIEPNGGRSNPLPGVNNALTLLQENKIYLQQEVLAYITATNAGFVFDQATCERDIAYMVDAVTFDLKYGGNRMAVQSGLGYYDNVGTENVVEGEVTATIAAFDYLASIAAALITGTNYTPLQSSVPPVLGLSTGTIFDVERMLAAKNTITNIILNGPSVAGPQEPSPLNPLTGFNYDQDKCRRDTALIVSAISVDLLYDDISDSQFSGLQYWNQDGYTGTIETEITATIAAVEQLSILAQSYVSPTSNTRVAELFTTITNILSTGTVGVTDLVEYGGLPSTNPTIVSDYQALQDNKASMQSAVVAYVQSTFPSLSFDTVTCARDVGYMIDSVSFDILHGGNVQSIKSGVYYYDFSTTATSIPNEIPQTVAAYNYMKEMMPYIVRGIPIPSVYQTLVPQTVVGAPASLNESTELQNKIEFISNVIQNGPSVVGPLAPITGTITTSTLTLNAYNLLIANRSFIKEEVVAFVNATFNATQNAFDILKANKDFLAAETVRWLDITYNGDAFNYDQDLCYRDTGLIIDAVGSDILLGGNQKSIEAGKSYWNKGYNYVSGQVSTTTAALNYAKEISLKIIANQPVAPVTGTVATQVINTFFQYGDNYMPQEAVIRNFSIINNIIENGPSVAPPLYAGGGLFALTGLNGSDVLPPPTVTSVEELTPGNYLVGLSTATIGFGYNATLYFGDVLVFPLQDFQVEELSFDLTGNTSTWDQRKVDPIGGMGGSLVDGAVISDRSPIQSFVYDAFTQLTQGGLGVHITNNGYAQLVSVFTIFCSIGVLCDNGGIASITNSNCNFGDISLMSKGYGPRKFSGTVFNPPFRAFPFSPDLPGEPYLDRFYPNGYWPNLGRVLVYVPDDEDRPHIGLVMEVIPPDGHINEQGFPGFLNSQPSTSTLATGTIVLNHISTDDVSIGNFVYIRDQFGRQYNDDGAWYAATGTVVTDVNYNSITLNQALESGGGDITNPNFFTLYFCGNSYYTVQTSERAENPYTLNTNILTVNTDPYKQGPSVDQVSAHADSINYLKGIVADVVSNVAVTPSSGNTATQVINTTVIGGGDAVTFMNLRFDYIISIVTASDITDAEAVVPPNLRSKEGIIAPGAGPAVTLIELNIEFLAEEVATYVVNNYSVEFNGSNAGQKLKCKRDVKIILQRMIYDLQTGGNYESVYAGLSYWSRAGTYHIATLGEVVRRPDLFPDGSTVNFYQRSYISASGYLFEYVGAGTNYGALPQRGVADPDQLKETVQLNNGKVFFTSTDQNGDFRIGPGLVIAQATGVLSGRTFVQSLYANMTPFILAIE